jgi:hypothetical protein
MAHYTTEGGKSFEIYWITWNEIYCSQTTPVETFSPLGATRRTFSLKNLTGHIEEIQAHQLILDYAKAAALSVRLTENSRAVLVPLCID